MKISFVQKNNLELGNLHPQLSVGPQQCSNATTRRLNCALLFPPELNEEDWHKQQAQFTINKHTPNTKHILNEYETPNTYHVHSKHRTQSKYETHTKHMRKTFQTPNHTKYETHKTHIKYQTHTKYEILTKHIQNTKHTPYTFKHTYRIRSVSETQTCS